MKKILIITFSITVLLASGCSNTSDRPTVQDDSYMGKTEVSSTYKPHENSEITPSKKENPNKNSDGSVSENGSDEVESSNLFFFNSKVSKLNYKGEFSFDDIIKKDTTLIINELYNFKDGKVYELKLTPVEGVPVPAERLSLGYFYVQKDKIFKLPPTIEDINTLKSSDKIPSDSIIVCQESNLADKLNKDEKGFHHFIEVDGDIRRYRSYNDQVTTGYYESFSWKKGQGLVSYHSGFGAKRDDIDLQLIN